MQVTDYPEGFDPSKFAYVDTETTGLDPRIHQAFELAYALSGTPVIDVHLPHTLEFADSQAMRINRYHERGFRPFDGEVWKSHRRQDGSLLPPGATRTLQTIEGARADLAGKVIVGCNPAFDQEFLRNAFGYQNWHYRLLDLEAWGAGVLGYDQPLGNKDLQSALRDLGYEIEESDHTAVQDVATLRQCHLALLHFQRRDSQL